MLSLDSAVHSTRCWQPPFCVPQGGIKANGFLLFLGLQILARIMCVLTSCLLKFILTAIWNAHREPATGRWSMRYCGLVCGWGMQSTGYLWPTEGICKLDVSSGLQVGFLMEPTAQLIRSMSIWYIPFQALASVFIASLLSSCVPHD